MPTSIRKKPQSEQEKNTSTFFSITGLLMLQLLLGLLLVGLSYQKIGEITGDILSFLKSPQLSSILTQAAPIVTAIFIFSLTINLFSRFFSFTATNSIEDTEHIDPYSILVGTKTSRNHISGKSTRNDFYSSTNLSIQIDQDPLTLENLATFFSALTELSTKYWLIAKGRLADLAEYTQTHNIMFTREANIITSKISYNSPFNIDLKLDMSASNVAEALRTTIDAVSQKEIRKETARLTNTTKVIELQNAQQAGTLDQQKTSLELEEKRLENEKKRLEIVEKRLEIQLNAIEKGLDVARKAVDILSQADPSTHEMIMQMLLPTILQIQNVEGLTIRLSEPKDATTKKPESK